MSRRILPQLGWNLAFLAKTRRSARNVLEFRQRRSRFGIRFVCCAIGLAITCCGRRRSARRVRLTSRRSVFTRDKCSSSCARPREVRYFQNGRPSTRSCSPKSCARRATKSFLKPTSKIRFSTCQPTTTSRFSCTFWRPVRAGDRSSKGCAPDPTGRSAHWRISGCPRVVEGLREAKVRKTAAPMGHVSVFSPTRVRRMARACGLRVEFLSGAFFVRSKGSPLENSALWVRLNVLWGAAFPSWPGELYWLMRKPGSR